MQEMKIKFICIKKYDHFVFKCSCKITVFAEVMTLGLLFSKDAVLDSDVFTVDHTALK